MFAILLPKIFPTAIPGWGGILKIAFILTASSGIVVPNAKVKVAIAKFDIFIFFPRDIMFFIR